MAITLNNLNSENIESLLKSSLDTILSRVALLKNGFDITNMLKDQFNQNKNLQVLKRVDLTPNVAAAVASALTDQTQEKPEQINSNNDSNIGSAVASTVASTLNNQTQEQSNNDSNISAAVASAVASTLKEQEQEKEKPESIDSNDDSNIGAAVASGIASTLKEQEQEEDTPESTDSTIGAAVASAVASTLKEQAQEEEQSKPIVSNNDSTIGAAVSSGIASTLKDQPHSTDSNIGAAVASAVASNVQSVSLNNTNYNGVANYSGLEEGGIQVFSREDPSGLRRENDLNLLLKSSLDRVFNRIVLFKNIFNVTNMLNASVKRAQKIQIPKNKLENEAIAAAIAAAVSTNTTIESNEQLINPTDATSIAAAIAASQIKNPPGDTTKPLDNTSAIAAAIAAASQIQNPPGDTTTTKPLDNTSAIASAIAAASQVQKLPGNNAANTTNTGNNTETEKDATSDETTIMHSNDNVTYVTPQGLVYIYDTKTKEVTEYDGSSQDKKPRPVKYENSKIQIQKNDGEKFTELDFSNFKDLYPNIYESSNDVDNVYKDLVASTKKVLKEYAVNSGI